MAHDAIIDPAPAYTRRAGEEPLPGYRLVEPLGRGGFGEVWKCVAPGGLHKAVKFVRASAGGDELRQELAAFEQIKAIRHPFLLTLERVELVGGDLVMVMELADRQLLDRFEECRAAGRPGIPRAELLGCLADAAEALDVIAARFGLQHLDVKPANLFLTAGRVKVGDYGLVSRLDAADTGAARGLTPKYVAPEVLKNTPSPRSDQYSLALVYHELLTGTFPYVTRNPRQLMLQHMSAAPDLSGLPDHDRPAVGRALAKNPAARFESSLEFVRALLAADSAAGDPALALRQARYANLLLTPGPLTSAPPSVADTRRNVHHLTPPPITLPTRRVPPARAPAPAEEPLPVAEEAPDDRVRLDPIRPVVAVDRLLGRPAGEPGVSAAGFAAALLDAALAGERLPQLPGDLGRAADGRWLVRFPSTVPAAVVPFKLQTVAGDWAAAVDETAPDRVTIRKTAPGSMWGSLTGRKAGGLEVVVRPGPGRGVGEVTVTGGLVGQPDAAFARAAEEAVPRILAAVRRELQNVDDRRKHPRAAAGFRADLYPVHSDGAVDPVVPARCADVSAGGVGLAVGGVLPTKYVYAAFPDVLGVAGLAVLLRLVRKTSRPGVEEHAYGAAYRGDL